MNIRSQKGAMFGLDARITMAIFGALSVIAGVYMTMNINDIRSSALTEELDQMQQVIEGVHQDLQADLHSSLAAESDENAIIALWDPERITPGRTRARWNGPYVEYRDIMHPRYGEMSLTKAAADHNNVCNLGRICYLWFTLGAVPIGMVDDVNANFDGSNETSAANSGKIQWEGAGETVKLYFRATNALN